MVCLWRVSPTPETVSSVVSAILGECYSLWDEEEEERSRNGVRSFRISSQWIGRRLFRWERPRAERKWQIYIFGDKSMVKDDHVFDAVIHASLTCDPKCDSGAGRCKEHRICFLH